ncbi:SRPBCC domain-containing protein [Sandaracinus amylolyticus]|uniref:SRPBCC domain-containing protein n=1 Tax=Sandaracinus amylolyticus TaxID=927083 RepID=UPI0009466C46|nr:SRPBCC domain-containing protein [Sandaracinus amylolyticus]
MSLPPLRRSVDVPLARDAAFDLFVRRLPEWWPLRTRSVGLERALSCHVEARVGGRLYERSDTGDESDWGRFRVLEAPARAVFSWHPGAPETAATEVEVRFTSTGDTSTRVELEHRQWERLGARASFVRGLFEGGWGPVLSRFEALARGEHDLPPVEGPGCVPR